MCRAPFLGQRSRSHGLFKFPVILLRISALTWRIHFICGTHTTHKKATCHTPFTGQRSRSHGSSEFLACALSGSVPIWPIHFIWSSFNLWEGNVSRTISRSRGQRSRSHKSFKVFACPLCASLTNSLHICYTCSPWEQRRQCVAHHFQVKGSNIKVMGRSYFCCVQLCGSVPIWLIHFNYMNPGYFTLAAIDLKP